MDIFWINGRCGRIAYLLALVGCWFFICETVSSIMGVPKVSVLVQEMGLWSMFSYTLYFLLNSIGSLYLPDLILFLSWWMMICVGVQRCHDIGKNGWWQFIPFYCLWLLVKKGDEGENGYE